MKGLFGNGFVFYCYGFMIGIVFGLCVNCVGVEFRVYVCNWRGNEDKGSKFVNI